MGAANISTLPLEVVFEIFSYLPQEKWHIARLALVNQYFHRTICSLLYKKVHMVDTGSLPGVKKSDWDDKLFEVSTSRQARLLQTLVKNPEIAAIVQSFKQKFEGLEDDALTFRDCSPHGKKKGENDVGSKEFVPELSIALAWNLVSLKTAWLVHSPLATILVQTPRILESLRELRLCTPGGIFCHWPREARTQIQHLEIYLARDCNPRDANLSVPKYEQLIELFMVTCSNLEHMQVTSAELNAASRLGYHAYTGDALSEARVWSDITVATAIPHLASLRHFGVEKWVQVVKYLNSTTTKLEDDLETATMFFNRICSQYSQQLKSVTWGMGGIYDGGYDFPDEQQVRHRKTFLSAVATSLSALDSIRIGSEWGVDWDYSESYLSDTLLARLIKLQFVTFNAPHNLSQIMSKTSALQDLKIEFELAKFRLESEFISEGWLEHEKLFRKLKKLLRRLPLGIRNIDLRLLARACFMETDFEAVFNMEGLLFYKYRWLHTVSIALWNNDADGDITTTYAQNQAIFTRRPAKKPHTKLLDSVWLKDEYYGMEHRNVFQHRLIALVAKGRNDEGWHGRDGKEWWFDEEEYERMHYCACSQYAVDDMMREKFYEDYTGDVEKVSEDDRNSSSSSSSSSSSEH